MVSFQSLAMENPAPATSYTVPVPEHKAGTRLDKLLADAVPALSRTRLKALILAGLVVRATDGAGPVRDPAHRVRAGERFDLTVPAARPAQPRPQALPLDVVYEDDDVIVVDKPAGLVVHPAPGHPDGTLVNALLAHCGDSLSGIGGVTRPGIVHRLDKDTSGLMVSAKNDAAHRHLSAQIGEHSVARVYQAVVWGVPAPRQGEIAGNIGRSSANRKKMAVVARGGKPALTRYRVLRVVGTRASLVQCRLTTGRTHQIRVHMAGLGHSIVGDPLYGRDARRRLRDAPEAARRAVAAFDRQALHACLIGFRHPGSGKWLRFTSEIPPDINELVGLLEAL